MMMNTDFDCSVVLDCMINSVKQAPGFCYLLDYNEKYLACSANHARYMGVDDISEILGKRDDDGCWKQYAAKYSENIRKVCQQQRSMRFIETACLQDGTEVTAFTTYYLLKEHGHVVGIFVHVNPILDIEAVKKSEIIQQEDLQYFCPTPTQVQDIKNDFFGISKKESECLYYFVRGKTIAETAIKLHLSSRTIEWHLNNLKKKFNCKSRSAMVELAIVRGYLNYIPTSLLN